MKLLEYVLEFICVIGIFAAGYGLLLIGHGMGW